MNYYQTNGNGSDDRGAKKCALFYKLKDPSSNPAKTNTCLCKNLLLDGYWPPFGGIRQSTESIISAYRNKPRQKIRRRVRRVTYSET